MCDTDSVKTVSWDPNDPYELTNIRPQGSPSALKAGRPPLKLFKSKPRSPDKILSTALHHEKRNLAEIQNQYNNNRFRSLAYINFVTTLQVSRHLQSVKSYQQVDVLFDKLYHHGKLISLQQINALDSLHFEWPDEDTPPKINYALFPLATPLESEEEKMEPQSGFLPPSSPIFEECQKAVNASLDEYVAQYPQLAQFLTAPSYAIVLGLAFFTFVIYRICRDLVLSVKFVLGFTSGFIVKQHSSSRNYSPQSSMKKRKKSKTTKTAAHKAKVKAEYDLYYSHLKQAGCYTPQSGSLDTAKTYSQYLSKIATVAAAFVSLATLIADNRKKDSYSPQSGLESDDGAKFLGKVTPKFGSQPDKPATSGAPGISTVLNGKNLFQQPRVAPPKPISKKDPNDGPLNGFGIGI